MLKPMVKRAGYLKVGIHPHQYYVHHLVALAFIGPRPDGTYVLHRDDDRTNNRLDNIYYGTPADNAVDRVKNGLWLNPSQILSDIDRHFIRLFHKAGYTRKQLREMFNCSRSTIQRVVTT